MVFECRHDIQNQPVSTTIPSPSSFRNITTLRKHSISVRFLNTFFLMFFKTVSQIAQHSIGTPSIGFHSYPQELVYVCSYYKFVCPLFTQEFWVLGQIQILKCCSLPQHLPTPMTYNITTLLPISTNKEPTYLISYR